MFNFNKFCLAFEKRKGFLSIEILDTFHNTKQVVKADFCLSIRMDIFFTRMRKYLFNALLLTPLPPLAASGSLETTEIQKMCTQSTAITFYSRVNHSFESLPPSAECKVERKISTHSSNKVNFIVNQLSKLCQI